MAEKKPLGLLILHGFTGSLDTVKALVPRAEARGWPWRMPVMRGHGTKYQDLVGVRYGDWVADAEAALDELLGECEKVVIAGLSMGALVAFTLAMKREKDLAGLVVFAPALRFADPLTPLTPIIKLFFPFWDAPSSFEDKALEARVCTNYKKFPTAAFSQLLDFGNDVERKLGQVRVPVVGLYAKKDKTIHKIVPKLLADRLGGPYREIWFEATGHEMLQDCEADAVADAAIEAVASLQQPAAQGA